MMKNPVCVYTKEQFDTLGRWLNNGAKDEDFDIIKHIGEEKLLDWLVVQYYSYQIVDRMASERLKSNGEMFTRNEFTDYLTTTENSLVSWIKKFEIIGNDGISNIAIANKPRGMIDFGKWGELKTRIYNKISERETVYLCGESTEKREIAISAVKETLFVDSAINKAITISSQNETDDPNQDRYILGKAFIEAYLASWEKCTDDKQKGFSVISLDNITSNIRLYHTIYDAAVSGQIVIIDGIEKMENLNGCLLSLKPVFSTLYDFRFGKARRMSFLPHIGEFMPKEGFGIVLYHSKTLWDFGFLT